MRERLEGRILSPDDKIHNIAINRETGSAVAAGVCRPPFPNQRAAPKSARRENVEIAAAETVGSEGTGEPCVRPSLTES